jgi:IclR family KDG regulon transcriptional repressor
MSDTTFLNTLANGLRVLETLVGRELTLREIANEVDLPRQTAYRIIHTLIQAGWVNRDTAKDTYALTPHIWSLGVRSFGLADLRKALEPTVRKLSDKWGETVHLAVYDRGSVVYIAKEEGSHPIRSYTELGGRSPAYCVATGKVLLASRNPMEWDEIANLGLESFTPLTLVTRTSLVRELDLVRDQGYAVNRGEWREGVAGVAVPVLSPAGEVIAALGFSGPEDRLMPQLPGLLSALQEAVPHALDYQVGTSMGESRD